MKHSTEEKIDQIKMFTSPVKGELTVVISKNNNKFDVFDVDEIKNVTGLKKYSIKDVAELIVKREKISKKEGLQDMLRFEKNAKKLISFILTLFLTSCSSASRFGTGVISHLT